MLNVQLYVGAVTLNNIGVQLMDLGSREDALKTMLDSVRAFRMAALECSSSASLAVEAKVQRAFNRLSVRQASAGDKGRNDAPPHKQPGLRLERISLPESGVVERHFALRYTHDLHAALVLRNAAIAFYCLSMDYPKGGPVQDSLIQNTYRMLQMADGIICRGFALVADEDPRNELCLYMVASSVVATIMCLYSEMGRMAEALALESKHRRLVNVIRQYQHDDARTGPVACE
jgi:hypothetical protein